MRACCVEDCALEAKCKGMCKKHYSRFVRTGSPLGSPKYGAAKRFLAEVVLPYQGDDCLAWPFAKTKEGYGLVHVGKDNRLVSRIACEDEHGPSPTNKHEAAHSCGNGHLGCVTRKHLRWATRAENRQDMIDHGRSTRGTKCAQSKLTESQVIEIRALRGTSAQRDIASRFGVDPSTISRIRTGDTWSWLEAGQ
jgi:hypothetical protein